jgi:hypothetical protein
VRIVEVKGATDAEVMARRLIVERHSGVRRILFKRVDKMDGSWLVEGEVWYRLLGIFTVKKFFKLQISSTNGKATSYQETLFRGKR